MSASSGNQITSNNVIHNGPFDGIGLFGPSSNNLLENNVVSGNDVAFTGDDGIRIESTGAKDNRVIGNSVTASTLDGIAVFSDQGTGHLNTGTVIEGNTVTGNGFGLIAARPGDGIRTFLRGNGTIIRNNHVQDNARSGILVGSTGNQITDDTSIGNVRQAAPSSPRYDLHDTNAGCDANVWSGNVFGTAFPACTTGP